MRKNEKEIKDNAIIEDILRTNHVCRIALSHNDFPYIVSMNYGYKDGVIYLHSASEGKKIDIIKSNNNVCFEITDSVKTIHSGEACKFTTAYRSVIGFGKIHIVDSVDEKKEGLLSLMTQHTFKSDWDMPAEAIDKQTVLKITIDEITGKRSGV